MAAHGCDWIDGFSIDCMRGAFYLVKNAAGLNTYLLLFLPKVVANA
jgi:hypothetical protein